MTEVKICGIRRQEDVVMMNECLPEMVGFVFYPPSRRYVSFEEAYKLREGLDDRIRTVGVFVDSDPDTMVEAVDSGIVSAIQLHGNENEAVINGLRDRTDAEIIQAFIIRDEDDIRSANLSVADYVLLDNGKGTGNSFDWSLIDGMEREYILSGGLTPENVGEAVRMLKPFAVDVSSGVESDGCKDPYKVNAFIDNVRMR